MKSTDANVTANNDNQPNQSIDINASDSVIRKDGRLNILVAYATGFGSTREVAEVIAEELRESGASVDLRRIDDIDSFNNAIYDAVFIGSAIRYDHWMSVARKFVKHHQYTLSTVPVAYFFTCLTLSKITVKSQKQAMGSKTHRTSLSGH